MRRAVVVIVLALAATLAAAAPAPAQSVDAIVRPAVDGLRSDPVYVHPRAQPGLTESERGRVRLRIARRALGRIRIAVLPASAAQRAGGAEPLARAIDAGLEGVRGTLVVVAGPAVHAVTSYPDSASAVAAIRRGFQGRPGRTLAQQLSVTVDGLGRADPGRPGDVDQLQRGQTPGGGDGDDERGGDAGGGSGSGPGRTSNPDFPFDQTSDPVGDFLDPITDAFRLGILIVAAAVALPFLIGGIVAVRRHRRRAGEEAQALADERADAHTALVALGDELRELDFDVSLPGANAAGVAYYNNALAAYERGDRELQRATGARRIARAQAEIAEGRRLIAAARALLAGPATPAAGERGDA